MLIYHSPIDQNDDDVSYVVVPLLDCFQNEVGEQYHWLILAEYTSSGSKRDKRIRMATLLVPYEGMTGSSFIYREHITLMIIQDSYHS